MTRSGGAVEAFGWYLMELAMVSVQCILSSPITDIAKELSDVPHWQDNGSVWWASGTVSALRDEVPLKMIRHGMGYADEDGGWPVYVSWPLLRAVKPYDANLNISKDRPPGWTHMSHPASSASSRCPFFTLLP